jgi:XTP/dITP diphosphohydrolase
MLHAFVCTTSRTRIREIRAMLDGVAVEIVGLGSRSLLSAPDETGTPSPRARASRRATSAATGIPAIAEDSGLEVDARWMTRPGIESARFAGAETSYPEKFTVIPGCSTRAAARRSAARFVCALAVASGEEILFGARGTAGGQ